MLDVEAQVERLSDGSIGLLLPVFRSVEGAFSN